MNQLYRGKSNTFGWAINTLKDGRAVTRTGWNGQGMWLRLQLPNSRFETALPYIYMSTAQGDIVPWSPSQMDVLETDWILAD